MKKLLTIPSYRSLTLPLGALFLTACGAASADPGDSHDTPPPPAQVRVTEASEGPVASSYIVTGTVRGLNTATLTSRMMGYVETLDAAVGERVVRGQLLATLDDADPPLPPCSSPTAPDASSRAPRNDDPNRSPF